MLVVQQAPKLLLTIIVIVVVITIVIISATAIVVVISATAIVVVVIVVSATRSTATTARAITACATTATSHNVVVDNVSIEAEPVVARRGQKKEAGECSQALRPPVHARRGRCHHGHLVAHLQPHDGPLAPAHALGAIADGVIDGEHSVAVHLNINVQCA